MTRSYTFVKFSGGHSTTGFPLNPGSPGNKNSGNGLACLSAICKGNSLPPGFLKLAAPAEGGERIPVDSPATLPRALQWN
jgi:hypothetical protein